MTEEEKMRQGLLYDANYDEELLAERRRCKELCFEYNRLSPAREDERRALIRRLLGRTGRRFEINAPFWCDYGRNVEIGENFTPTIIALYLTGQKSFSATTFLSVRTADSIPPGIRLTPDCAAGGWNTRGR